MKFKMLKGSPGFVGSVPFSFLEDTEVEIQADSYDHLAELFAASGGQRAFGAHLEGLKHDEVITKDINGEAHEVTLEVTYGAGGARLTKEKGEPRKVKPKLAAASPAAIRSADAPVTVTDAVDPLAEKARVEFKERTDFRPPPGRFPDVVQTATDHPVDETGNVVEGEKAKTSPAADKSKAADTDKKTTDDKPKTDSFPVDFPGRTALLNARITKPSQLKGKTSEDLQKISGIGPETADKILEALE